MDCGDLVGMNVQFCVYVQVVCLGQIGQQVGFVVDLWCYVGDWVWQVCGVGCQYQLVGCVGQVIGLFGDVQVQVECEIQCVEDELVYVLVGGQCFGIGDVLG